MKKLFSSISIIVLTATLWAQSPQKMSYQAVIRNSSQVLVTSAVVGMKISILQGSATGTAVFVETQTPTTNANGLISIEIGSGTPVTGTIGNINWANGSNFIKTETDPSGGTNYTISGTSQLLSVPYALYAKTAGDTTIMVKTFGDQTIAGIKTFNKDILVNGQTIGEGNGAISSNVAIGNGALHLNINGESNTAIGYNSLYSNTSGSNNTANGSGSLFSNTTGSNNTANGRNVLSSNTIGTENTATGFSALNLNTTGNSNTANGFQTLYANTTGAYNTAVGGNAMRYNSVGNNNTAVGDAALFANTSGGLNTATGVNALGGNTNGFYNTANGYGALYLNTTGNSNTADGNNALNANSTGSQNTAIGSSALEVNTTGNFNTALGNGALNMLTSGVNNIGIGYAAQVPTATGSNQVRMGNTFITYAGIQVAWSVTSDRKLKSEITKSDLGLDFIKKLNPVSYLRNNDETQKTEYGFIAQEVDETLNSIGAIKTGFITKDDAGMYSIRYNDFIAPMVKAMQEQQIIIEEDKTKINTLEEENKRLENRLKAIEEKLKL